MGYLSQVALVLTTEMDERLRTAADAIESPTLRGDVAEILRGAGRFTSERQGPQVLYFWDWRKWYPTDETVAWITRTLDGFPIDGYYLRILEEEGDTDFDGELEDGFELSVCRFLDLDPQPDLFPRPRTASARLLDACRILVSVCRRSPKEGGSLEWREIAEAYRLAAPALGFFDGE